jgi:hypothetical protein
MNRLRRSAPLPTTILVALAIVGAPRRADAVEIRDAPSGLRLEVATPDVTLCATYPASLRTNAGPCAQQQALAPVEPSSFPYPGVALVAAFVAVPPDRAFRSLVVTRAPAVSDDALSRAAVDSMVRATRRNITRAWPAGAVSLRGGLDAATHETFSIEGVTVVRYVLALDAPPALRDDVPERIVFYHAFGGQGVVSLRFESTAAGFDRAVPEANAIVRRLRLPRRTHESGLSRFVGVPFLILTIRLSATRVRRNRRVRALEARLGAAATLDSPQIVSSFPLRLRQVRAAGSLATPDEVRARALDWAAREGLVLARSEAGTLRFRRRPVPFAAISFDLRNVPCTVEVTSSSAVPPRTTGALVTCTMEYHSWAHTASAADVEQAALEFGALLMALDVSAALPDGRG